MNWKEYENKFILFAMRNNKSQKYCDDCLNYAKNLFSKNLPIIYNPKHFSLLVGYDLEYIFGVCNKQKKFYRYFYIQKKNGKYRKISEPLPNLKEIQNWILNEILYSLDFNKYSKAFKKNSSVKDNAVFHRKQKYVMNLDIHDYFGSIKYGRVYSFFLKLGYSKSVSTLLSNICTLNGSLPQGSPTSPALSNLITSKMDDSIANYTKSLHIRYTRYADDMTFSGDFNRKMLLRKVRSIVNSYGFKLNDEKTRIRSRGQQQEVTGIVVNEKMQIEKEKRRKIRQEFYYIKKFGIESHCKYLGIDDEKSYLKSLIGKAAFGMFVNPYDMELYNIYVELSKLII